MRWRIGSVFVRFGEWLRYPSLVVCQKPGCGYVNGGVHVPVSECPMCQRDPSRAGEHHAFVAPPWWKRIGSAS